MLKLPVLDVDGEKLGVVNDFGIATGEVFPHVTSLAFRGPGKTPFMISWRKWVDRIDETGVHLKTSATEIRFSYLQPTELLLARDVLNKQIVDTQGMKVVRVNDIKFSMSGENQLRLLGAEVGARGLLRAISPTLEHVVEGFMKHLGKPLGEDIIASAIAIVIVLLTGKYLLAIFNNDPQVIEIGYSRLLILFGSYIFSLTYEILSGYLRGFGISLVPAILTLFGVCGVRIVWINTVFPLHHTFRSIMLVYPISLATTAVLIFIALLVYRPSRRFAAAHSEKPQA